MGLSTSTAVHPLAILSAEEIATAHRVLGFRDGDRVAEMVVPYADPSPPRCWSRWSRFSATAVLPVEKVPVEGEARAFGLGDLDRPRPWPRCCS
jgi:hypothetical protein